MVKQIKHITVDDISELQALERLLKQAKSDLKLHYKHALEVENGNVNRAIKRLALANACTVLNTAFEYATLANNIRKVVYISSNGDEEKGTTLISFHFIPVGKYLFSS